MTGGGTGHCLQSQEAKGLGEGWSDAVAEYVHSYSSQTQFNLTIKYNLIKLGFPDFCSDTKVLSRCMGDG